VFKRVVVHRASTLVVGWLGTLETLQSVRVRAGALYVEQLEASARLRFGEYEAEMTDQDRYDLAFNLRHRSRGDA
jgi:hypothetical protein